MNTATPVVLLAMRKAVVQLIVVMTLALTPSLASALTFTLIQFPGATFTEALGINDRGQIVERVSGPAELGRFHRRLPHLALLDLAVAEDAIDASRRAGHLEAERDPARD